MKPEGIPVKQAEIEGPVHLMPRRPPVAELMVDGHEAVKEVRRTARGVRVLARTIQTILWPIRRLSTEFVTDFHIMVKEVGKAAKSLRHLSTALLATLRTLRRWFKRNPGLPRIRIKELEITPVVPDAMGHSPKAPQPDFSSRGGKIETTSTLGPQVHQITFQRCQNNGHWRVGINEHVHTVPDMPGMVGLHILLGNPEKPVAFPVLLCVGDKRRPTFSDQNEETLLDLDEQIQRHRHDLAKAERDNDKVNVSRIKDELDDLLEQARKLTNPETGKAYPPRDKDRDLWRKRRERCLTMLSKNGLHDMAQYLETSIGKTPYNLYQPTYEVERVL